MADFSSLKFEHVHLSSKLSITYGGNINYYKSVQQPIPTLSVRAGNTLANQ